MSEEAGIPERTFGAAFQRAPTAMMIADDSRRYVDVNDAACRLFGLPRECIVGQRIDEFTTPGKAEALEGAWRAFLAAGEQAGTFELRGQEGPIKVEFHATANFQPGLHLSLLQPLAAQAAATQGDLAELPVAAGTTPTLLAMAISALVLFGWAANLPLLRAFGPSLLPTAPSTAFAVLALGTALLLRGRTSQRSAAGLATGLAAVTGALSTWVLVSALGAPRPWFEVTRGQWRGAVAQGQMSPLTALALLSLSLALLFQGFPKLQRWGPWCSLFACGWSALMLLGYLYGVPLLYLQGRWIPMALPTALSLASLAVGALVLAGPSYWPLRLLVGTGIRARLLRVFLPLTLGGAILIGPLSAWAWRQTSANPAVISALLAAAALVVVTFCLSAASRTMALDLAKSERARAQAVRAVAQADELSRFKDEMSALLVHDIKSPLAALSANLDFLGQQPASPDARAALADCAASVKRLTALAKNLLDVTRLEEGRFALHRQPVGALSLLQSAAAPRQVEALQRAVSIRIEAETELKVDADPELLLRVLENLLDNALRYTPERGTIVLAAQKPSLDRLWLQVGNSGPPIPRGVRERIFEKFQRAEGSSSVNLGLGLYFCRLAIEAHGGSLAVLEQPELPTVFRAEFPAA